MKRWVASLLVVWGALAVCAANLQAAKPQARFDRERMQYPPRYKRASMSQQYVYRDRNGKVKVRQVYPGYAEGFPPPAYLYYGYPHSGDDTGLGF